MKYQPKNSGGEGNQDGHHGEGRGGYNNRPPKKYNNNQN